MFGLSALYNLLADFLACFISLKHGCHMEVDVAILAFGLQTLYDFLPFMRIT
jgi:hypothetical protein